MYLFIIDFSRSIVSLHIVDLSFHLPDVLVQLSHLGILVLDTGLFLFDLNVQILYLTFQILLNVSEVLLDVLLLLQLHEVLIVFFVQLFLLQPQFVFKLGGFHIAFLNYFFD
jgi:hypothetical protein